MDFDRDAYLRRVGLDSTVSNTEESLEALHRAQTFAIPFENLDIHLGRGVSLAQETLFDKLVNHRRGGYCFELNSLFGMALDAFGFERRPLLARSQRRGAPTSRTPRNQARRLNAHRYGCFEGFLYRTPRWLKPVLIHARPGTRLYRLAHHGQARTGRHPIPS